MCGINGIFAYHYAANPVDRREIVRSRDHMASRGPDGAGLWLAEDGRIGLAHRRLAIIDITDGGAQPMASADGCLIVTFNGEIYNYRQLRAELEARGRVFRSQSDTEVLLHLYAERGPGMVADLRGMFAFAIWDATRRELFLARDPFGIKPLYFADDGWTIRFASQVKALRAGGNVGGDPDPAGCVGFHLWGSVPEPLTSVRAVRALPAGTHMLVDRIGARQPVRYHSVAAAYCVAEKSVRAMRTPADRTAAIAAALVDSVRAHLVADVPVGLFLSAGIDSGCLAGLVRDAGYRDLQSITVSFEEFRGTAQDESVFAADVARLYGTRHTNYVVTRQEFEADLPRILAAMDQPSIDGINTWFVSKAAAAQGLKVAISGLGGDEMFGGYPSFADIPRWVSALAVPSRIPGLGRSFRQLFAAVPDRWQRANPKAAGLFALGGTYAGAYLLRRGIFMPWELGPLLDHDFCRDGLARLRAMRIEAHALAPCPETKFARVAALETQLYMRNQLLRDADWASMAHGLEVRVPLVDAPLLTAIAPLTVTGALPSGKEALACAPRIPLPTSVVQRAKTGFTTPIAQWQMQLLPHVDGARRRNEPWARRWTQFIAHRHALAA